MSEHVSPITCSVLEASALFNMAPRDFVRIYIHSRRIKPTKLHQLSMERVLTIYDQEKRGPWQRYKPVDF